MTDTFYVDFEAQFRGDRSIIIERLQVYEPFLTPLALQPGEAIGLDLGCGRGEWLEILSDAGLSARGVDLDEGMLTVARNRGLAVEKMDAVTALRATPNGTLAVVSAFQLIEHLSFDMVREILAEARRALRPGGIIILETPNPENPLVSLVNFHLDPTHIRPLPPALTNFAVEHVGFSRMVTLRLQGQTSQVQTASELYSLLTDISYDYAVVAQVEGPRANDLDQAFSLQLGMDLHSGIRRFDDANKAQILNVIKLIEDQKKEITALRNDFATLSATFERSWIERLFFRASTGRPTRILRRVLFHKSGKPRGVFRKWILKPDGRPRRAFRQWMNGPEYRVLSWPTSQNKNSEIAKLLISSKSLEPSDFENICTLHPKELRYRPYINLANRNVLIAEELFSNSRLVCFKLISALRDGKKLTFKRPLIDSDLPFVEKLIYNIYLSYLRRYPSATDAQELSKNVINNNSLDEVISGISASKEYKNIGYRRVGKRFTLT